MEVNRPKKKKFGWTPNNELLLRLMQSKVSILTINWVFQGMRGMQSKELSFRFGLETTLIILLHILVFSNYFEAAASVLVSIFVAHTLNWLLNTHLWVCVRYFPIYRRNPEVLKSYLNSTEIQINNIRWIDSAVCIGSIGDKGDVSSWRTDIDLRLIFEPGIFNYFRMNFYLIYLRTIALFTIIPLDLYAYNDISYLKNFKKDEGLMLLKDTANKIVKLYPEKTVYKNNE